MWFICIFAKFYNFISWKYFVIFHEYNFTKNQQAVWSWLSSNENNIFNIFVPTSYHQKKILFSIFQQGKVSSCVPYNFSFRFPCKNQRTTTRVRWKLRDMNRERMEFVIAQNTVDRRPLSDQEIKALLLPGKQEIAMVSFFISPFPFFNQW